MKLLRKIGGQGEDRNPASLASAPLFQFSRMNMDQGSGRIQIF